MSNDKSSDKPGATKAPEYAPQTRLAVVYFRAPVNFGGEEKESVSVPSKSDLERGQRSSNSVDDVRTVAVNADGTLDANGHAVATGLLLLRRRHNLNTSKREEVRTFVPWSNIRSISYGE